MSLISVNCREHARQAMRIGGATDFMSGIASIEEGSGSSGSLESSMKFCGALYSGCGITPDGKITGTKAGSILGASVFCGGLNFSSSTHTSLWTGFGSSLFSEVCCSGALSSSLNCEGFGLNMGISLFESLGAMC